MPEKKTKGKTAANKPKKTEDLVLITRKRRYPKDPERRLTAEGWLRLRLEGKI